MFVPKVCATFGLWRVQEAINGNERTSSDGVGIKMCQQREALAKRCALTKLCSDRNGLWLATCSALVKTATGRNTERGVETAHGAVFVKVGRHRRCGVRGASLCNSVL